MGEALLLRLAVIIATAIAVVCLFRQPLSAAPPPRQAPASWARLPDRCAPACCPMAKCMACGPGTTSLPRHSPADSVTGCEPVCDFRCIETPARAAFEPAPSRLLAGPDWSVAASLRALELEHSAV